jgi:hypothetical protein
MGGRIVIGVVIAVSTAIVLWALGISPGKIDGPRNQSGKIENGSRLR